MSKIVGRKNKELFTIKLMFNKSSKTLIIYILSEDQKILTLLFPLTKRYSSRNLSATDSILK